MRKPKLLLVLLFFCFAHFADSQDASFSQFYQVGHWYNPARVGSMEQDIKAGIHYRRQWTTGLNGFRTNGFNGEFKASKVPFAAGIVVIDDRGGNADLKTFQALASGSYTVKIDRFSILSAGFQLGFVQRSISMSELSWDAQYNGYQYDPSLDNKERQFSDQSGIRVDLGAGLFYRADYYVKRLRWGAGYGFKHLGQEQTFLQNGTDRLGLRHSFIGFAEKDFERFTGRLDVLLQRQRSAMELVVFGRGEYRFGSDSRYTKENNSSAIYAGCGLRNTGMIIPMVGFEWERKVDIGITYDIMLPGISDATGFTGGPEFCLIYRYRTDKRIKIY